MHPYQIYVAFETCASRPTQGGKYFMVPSTANISDLCELHTAEELYILSECFFMYMEIVIDSLLAWFLSS